MYTELIPAAAMSNAGNSFQFRNKSPFPASFPNRNLSAVQDAGLPAVCLHPAALSAAPLIPFQYFEWRFSFSLPRLRSGKRSEEHTSELQSRENLVCRLL